MTEKTGEIDYIESQLEARGLPKTFAPALSKIEDTNQLLKTIDQAAEELQGTKSQKADSEIDLKDFKRMSYQDRVKLRDEKPELYQELVSKSIK